LRAAWESSRFAAAREIERPAQVNSRASRFAARLAPVAALFLAPFPTPARSRRFRPKGEADKFGGQFNVLDR
jgi:hypothetical protein